MVCDGNSTTMELSEDILKHLGSCFDHLVLRLATREDVTEIKDDVSMLLRRVEEHCDKTDQLNSYVAKQDERIDVLEDRVAMLESHVQHLQKSHESQEQYSRRLCLQIDGIEPPKRGDHEKAEQYLDKV